jgi:hypothetical protein
MTELTIEIMRERLEEARRHPVKRSTLLSIGEWTTRISEYFMRPSRRDQHPNTEHSRAAAGG